MKFIWLYIFLLIFSLKVVAKDTLFWYHPNFPPANFVEGLMEGLGHNDQAEKFIAFKLPQYQHIYVTASYQRIMHSLKFGQGCAIGVFDSEKKREQLSYSIPFSLTFPNGLIILKSQAGKFAQYRDEQGAVSVKALLDDEKLMAGIADGRKYLGAIDKELVQHRGNDNIIVRSSTDVFSGLLQMLDKNRIDYLFGFPEELAYHTSLGVLDNEMQFLPISEMPKYLTNYIVCSKTDFGQQVIKEINQILQKHRTTPEFLRFYQFWLDFESKKRHRALSQSELLPTISTQEKNG